jgi:hypothetical protein
MNKLTMESARNWWRVRWWNPLLAAAFWIAIAVWSDRFSRRWEVFIFGAWCGFCICVALVKLNGHIQETKQ